MSDDNTKRATQAELSIRVRVILAQHLSVFDPKADLSCFTDDLAHLLYTVQLETEERLDTDAAEARGRGQERGRIVARRG